MDGWQLIISLKGRRKTLFVLLKHDDDYIFLHIRSTWHDMEDVQKLYLALFLSHYLLLLKTPNYSRLLKF